MHNIFHNIMVFLGVIGKENQFTDAVLKNLLIQSGVVT